MDVTVLPGVPFPYFGSLLEFGVLVSLITFEAIEVVDVAPLLVRLFVLPVVADVFHYVGLELTVGISLT